MSSRLAIGAGLSLLPAIACAAQLLVLNKGEATLSFIDPESGKTQTTIATGQGPHEIELSSDGAIAFVTNYGAQTDGNTISVIDVAERKELRRIDLGELRRPHGLTTAGGQLYFTAERARKIGRLDPRGERVDWTFATDQDGTHMVLASRDGNVLYATNIQSNSVSVIERDANDEWVQTLVSVGAGPEGLDLSPDGRELWVAHSRDGGISIIDVATKKVVQTFDVGTRRSNRLKFSRDGKTVLVSDLGAGALVAIDPGSRTVRARKDLGRAPTGILIAPSGNRAYVALSGENRIAVVDIGSLEVVSSITTGPGPDGMAWVP
ncbi:MAG TPA: beta-propeller fold lactonase family protein [Steroidobacteraceae bacterium]